MQWAVSLIIKALTSGLFSFLGDRLDAFKQDRRLKKLGAVQAKGKINAKRVKRLAKVEKRRARLRTDTKFRNRMRDKFTRSD